MSSLDFTLLTPYLLRIEAQDTTQLITLHQIHSQCHMAIHYDPSPCSILGLYPQGNEYVHATVFALDLS